MPLVISDEVLRAAGLTEREALIVFACGIFQARCMSLGRAGEIVGLSKVEMEKELAARNIPRYQYTAKMLEDDIRALKLMESWDAEGRKK